MEYIPNDFKSFRIFCALERKAGKMQQCCDLATLRTYKPFEIVYVEDKGRLNPVYFILSGSCTIMQYLKMNVNKENGSVKYELESARAIESASREIMRKIFECDDEQSNNSNLDLNHTKFTDKNDRNIKSHFVDVGTFGCGSVFGLGEQMEDRVIMAQQCGVQCLTIPRYWLLQKEQNVGNVWQRMKIYLDSTIPSRQKVFNNFLMSKKWKMYKRKLINETYAKKPNANLTKLEDVPVACRVNEQF